MGSSTICELYGEEWDEEWKEREDVLLYYMYRLCWLDFVCTVCQWNVGGLFIFRLRIVPSAGRCLMYGWARAYVDSCRKRTRLAHQVADGRDK